MVSTHRIHLQEDLQKLLNKICKEMKQQDICLHPFNRYGKSGSKLYLIYFSKKKDVSVPWLLKTFEDIDKFMDEKKGMEFIEQKYHNILRFKFFQGNGKLSGILLQHVSSKLQKVENSKTLANMLYKKNINKNRICKIIDNIYKEFSLVYHEVKTYECNLKREYHKYLRHDETRKIIEKLVGNIKGKEIYFYGQKITNPVYIFDHLIERTEMTKSLIHGDFHPSNIVIGDKDVPRIIDFAWSCKKDRYIDFSVFEMSVRYWDSPFLDYKAKNVLEDILLCENIKDYSKNQDAQRIITFVRKIRELCKTYIPNYDFKHHLLSQFIVLYGLQAFTDTYNPFIVIPFLAKLGDKLRELRFVID
jgi:thiamine kinase-like enzyme